MMCIIFVEHFMAVMAKNILKSQEMLVLPAFLTITWPKIIEWKEVIYNSLECLINFRMKPNHKILFHSLEKKPKKLTTLHSGFHDCQLSYGISQLGSIRKFEAHIWMLNK